MTERRAACSCGQLSVKVRGEPLRVSVCHCLACQKRTGSAFGVQARFPKDAVEVEGRSSEYVRIGDEGSRTAFHFCPGCGATVYYVNDLRPDAIAVPVGAFADPDFPPPTVSVYETRRHDWLSLPDDIERIG